MIKNLEIKLKSILLKIFLFLSKSNTSNEKPVFNFNSKILFIRLNRIGDALVDTPLLSHIKKELGAKIYVLADRSNYFIFSHCPCVDEVFIHEKGIKGIKKLNSIIKQKNIEAIVDLHPDVSVTVSLLVSFADCKYKFGFKKTNQKIYTHTALILKSDFYHIIERLLEISKLFELQPNYDEAGISYQLNPSSINFATSYLNDFKHKFLVGINITAGSDARFWGVEKFKELISLLSSYDLNYVVFTAKEKFRAALRITDEKHIYPTTDDFDIFAAGISKLDLLITPDTSVVHIASLFKIPVFGFYVKYKTTDMIWYPYKTDFECVITEEPTLMNVTFEEVKSKIIPFLEKQINAKYNSKM